MKLNTAKTELRITAGLPNQLPRDSKPQVALSGRSNVGKSSLLNTLIGRKSLARVSGQPGKTITINFYDIDGQVYFVDLPGYGYARRSDAERRRWSELTDGYLTSTLSDGRLKLIVQLIDLRTGPSQDDLMMLEWMAHNGVPFIIAATKADKPNKTDRRAMLDELAKHCDTVIPFSALNGEGKDELLRAIEGALSNC